MNKHSFLKRRKYLEIRIKGKISGKRFTMQGKFQGLSIIRIDGKYLSENCSVWSKKRKKEGRIDSDGWLVDRLIPHSNFTASGGVWIRSREIENKWIRGDKQLWIEKQRKEDYFSQSLFRERE